MRITLQSLMTEDHILLRSSADTWTEAITIAASPLINEGSITPDYVSAMIDNVNQFGPYIVLAPHVALAHAAPTAGVNRTAMSALVPRRPVVFHHPDNDPVRLIFCLASVDTHSHMAALRAFVGIAGNPDLCGQLESAANPHEFKDLIESSVHL